MRRRTHLRIDLVLAPPRVAIVRTVQRRTHLLIGLVPAPPRVATAAIDGGVTIPW